MGIKSIIFPQENENDFSGLDRAVAVLASFRRHDGTLEDYNNLGNALRKQGDLEGAIKAYRQARKIKPDDPEIYCNLGNALKEQRCFGEAIKAYRKALEIKGNSGKWGLTSSKGVRLSLF